MKAPSSLLRAGLANRCREHCAARPFSRCREYRTGNTLLEVVAATIMVGIAVVPALKYSSKAISDGRRIEMQSLVVTYAVSLMEQTMAETAANWNPGSSSGNLSSEGYSSLRYNILRSDSVDDGGVEDSLMVVTVTVWEDEDGDTAQDSGEPSQTYSSKIAKLSTYLSG